SRDGPSRKARNLRERDGWRSLRSALASIWRMRSRVTANDWPTSSSVCSLPSSKPKRILMTFSSRGVSVFNTDEVCSFKFKLITASDGETTALSSMKSPRCESSSSPIGVSSEIRSEERRVGKECRCGGLVYAYRRKLVDVFRCGIVFDGV